MNINECEFKPCFNNATCIDQTNTFSCKCKDGFVGRKCEKDIDECESNPCKNGGACIDKVNFSFRVKIISLYLVYLFNSYIFYVLD